MKTSKKRVLATSLIYFCFFHSPLFGGSVYYTALDGHNANPGTEALPFRTISRGVESLSAGDTLYVKAGTYSESILSWQTDIPVGTSWNNPVTVAVNPGDSVTVNPLPGQAFFWLKGEQIQSDNLFLIIDGFTVDGRNQAEHGFKFTGDTQTAKHVRVQNTEIKNTVASGILLSTPSIAQSPTFHEFINVSAHDSGRDRLSHGIYIATSSNLVKGGDYSFNKGYGIHQFNSSSTGVPSNNNVIDGAFVHDNNTDPGSVAAAGIVIGSGSGNIVKNSIIGGGLTENQGNGISVDFGAASDNNQVYNNTIYSNRLQPVQVGAFGPVTNTQIKNNIFFQNGTDAVSLGSNQTGTVQSNNLQFVWPSFVDVANGDFHLQPGSTAIDMGATLSEVTTDFDGNPRPQGSGYDVGAFEFVPANADFDADFNGDGDVDGSDFLDWQRGFGVGSTLPAGDANSDSTVDDADLSIWENQFGSAAALAGSATVVPEPASFALVGIVLALSAARRSHRFFPGSFVLVSQ